MIKLKIDRTDGGSLRQTSKGLEAQRHAYVTGIKQLRDAIEHPDLPRVGHPHPQLTHLVVNSITAKPDGPNAANITITYHDPSGNGDHPKVSIDTALRQHTTETDLDGNRITVSYSNTGEDVDMIAQGARVSVLRPQTQLTFTRLENAHPAKTAKTYAGTINRSSIFQGAPQTWLCTSIDATSDDGGNSFLVTYQFQYNASGWQPTVSYTDPKTNRPPADLVADVGIKQVELYRLEEFKNLGLGS
ncbi:MAG TPA: hypothetical protein DCM28_11000 [Phycisphaerales bacterium]|nr:hypothetical protein [Phycisphaerales bacterium]HCD32344.1 hypothetical protein [Phycisphaerales bacterium]|tara:strand:+ start:23795 stop:24529 length:735 start_codon:yes stop_codon:yes gene_type:complete